MRNHFGIYEKKKNTELLRLYILGWMTISNEINFVLLLLFCCLNRSDPKFLRLRLIILFRLTLTSIFQTSNFFNIIIQHLIFISFFIVIFLVFILWSLLPLSIVFLRLLSEWSASWTVTTYCHHSSSKIFFSIFNVTFVHCPHFYVI